MMSIETAVDNAPGSSAIPVSKAVKLRIDWKNNGRMSAVP